MRLEFQHFSYYMHEGPSEFSVELAGTWDAEGAKTVEQDWQNASAVIGGKELIDLSLVVEIDPRARQLLLRWFRSGATIVADTPKSRALTESIIGCSIPSTTRTTNTWSPYRSASFSINGEPGKQKRSDRWKPKTMIWW
jgi:hypothetical protein